MPSSDERPKRLIEVIVFLNDTKYERIDSKTGEKIERSRKGGGRHLALQRIISSETRQYR